MYFTFKTSIAAVTHIKSEAMEPLLISTLYQTTLYRTDQVETREIFYLLKKIRLILR